MTSVQVTKLAEWLRSEPSLRAAGAFDVGSVEARVLVGNIYGDYIRTPDDYSICCELPVERPAGDDVPREFSVAVDAQSCASPPADAIGVPSQ